MDPMRPVKADTEFPPCAAEVLRVVPERFVGAVSEQLRSAAVEEVRFRVDRPVQLRTQHGEIMLRQLRPFTREEAKRMLETVCSYSVYAKEQELARGFIGLPGGVRVGVAGEPVIEDGRIARLTDVTCFNIRIPREIKGCAEPFLPMFTEKTGDDVRPVSTLVAAPPGVGKTTFLRDLARCLSNGAGSLRPFCVAVADERNELGGSVGGVPTLDIGERTDIMCGVPKAAAMPILLRSMAPEAIVTDELDGKQDMIAVSEAAKYGVAVFASIHAGSSAELACKKWLTEPIANGLRLRVLLLRRFGGRFSLRSAELFPANAAEERICFG